MLGDVIARRAWLIAALAIAAALVAGAFELSRPGKYQSHVVYLIQPSPRLNANEIPDALRGNSGGSAELEFTVAQVLQTDYFRNAITPALPTSYTINASVPPATSVVDVTIKGRDRAVLKSFASAFSARVQAWMQRTYPAYRLTLLQSRTSKASRASSLSEVIILGALLGIFAGILGASAESWLKRRRRERWLEGERLVDGPSDTANGQAPLVGAAEDDFRTERVP